MGIMSQALFFALSIIGVFIIAGFFGFMATKGFWSATVIILLAFLGILNITLTYNIDSLLYSLLLLALFLIFIKTTFTSRKLFKHIDGSSDLLDNQQGFVFCAISAILFLGCYALELPVAGYGLWVHLILATLITIGSTGFFDDIKDVYNNTTKHVIETGFAEPKHIINEYLKDKEKIKEKETLVNQILSDMIKWKKNRVTKVQGKNEIYFLQEIYDRIIIDLKEKRNGTAIQQDIQLKFNKMLPLPVIATVYSATNIETVEEYNDITKNFSIMKYEFNNNHIKELNVSYRESYVKLLQHIILENCGKTIVIDEMFVRAQQELGVTVPVRLLTNDELMQSLDIVEKKVFKYKFPFDFSRKDYKYTLMIEAFYLLCLILGHLNYDAIKNYSDLLKIKEKEVEEIIAFLESEFMKTQDPTVFIEGCKSNYLRIAMDYIHKNTHWNKIYYSLPRYSVAVCATMSSGKSTFVNALLGYDYIPSSNQACTAKITSISDNDYLNKIIGCSITQNQKVTYNQNLDKGTLEEWNENNDVDRILLEGELEEVSSKSGVLVIHDTPGTNFSQNATHSQQTFNFLKQNKVDLIIFLINAEHSSTTDNTFLLKQIMEICQINPRTQILFLVNKLDSFDIEGGDDIKECLDGVRKELTDLGFVSPLVLPIIANGARLFKMALKGETLTKREIMTFEDSFEFCMNTNGPHFDATNSQLTGFNFTGTIHSKEGNVTVGKKEYSINELQEALKRSGITMVTQILDNQINGGR